MDMQVETGRPQASVYNGHGNGEIADLTKIIDQPEAEARLFVTSIDRYAGPALLVSGDGWVIYANSHADPLVAALKGVDNAISATVERALASMAPVYQKLSLNDNGTRHFDVYALPLGLPQDAAGGDEGRAVLVLAKDTTLDQNLSQSLTESRQMFKDLVSCSPDFGFETDAEGIFRYVTPQGAFGYLAHELTGRPAIDLLEDGTNLSPFCVRERTVLPRIFIKRKDGGRAVVELCATPIQNAKGKWIGARGICRDITRETIEESIHRDLATLHQLTSRLLILARSAIAPTQIMNDSASLVAAALGADVWIMRRTDSGTTGGIVISGRSNLAIDDKVEEQINNRIKALFNGHRLANGGILNETLGGRRFVVLPTIHHGVINGAIVALHETDDIYSELQMRILDEAAACLSVTIEQEQSRAMIDALTVTDELTGIMNRRAFENFLDQRVGHQRRTGYPSTLLVIELRNLATLEDPLGLPYAETALRKFAAMLQKRSRIGDVAARLDYNRFALWLEDTDLDGGLTKARNTLNHSQDVVTGRVTGKGLLEVAIGVAPCQKYRSAAEIIDAGTTAVQAIPSDREEKIAIKLPQGEIRFPDPPFGVLDPS